MAKRESSRCRGEEASPIRLFSRRFIAGEYGFYSTPKEYATFLATIDSAGGTSVLHRLRNLADISQAPVL